MLLAVMLLAVRLRLLPATMSDPVNLASLPVLRLNAPMAAINRINVANIGLAVRACGTSLHIALPRASELPSLLTPRKNYEFSRAWLTPDRAWC